MDVSSATLSGSALATRPVLDDVSIVIPTLGRHVLEQSLYFIVSSSSWPARLVVVDQGNVPDVAAWIARLRALGLESLYVPCSKKGRAVGINIGLQHVETRFVAVTDDDCFVAPDWLQCLVQRLRADPNMVVTGRVEAAGEDAMINVVTSPTGVVFRKPRLSFDVMSGGNMATSMDVMRRVGFFNEDPRMRTSEDGEWAYRVLRAGVPISYAPEVVVTHYGWRSETDRFRQYRDYARSHGGFYGKYLRKGDWFIAARAVIHHVRALKRALRGTLLGDREARVNGLAYLTGLLPGIVAGIRREGPIDDKMERRSPETPGKEPSVATQR